VRLALQVSGGALVVAGYGEVTAKVVITRGDVLAEGEVVEDVGEKVDDSLRASPLGGEPGRRPKPG